MTFYQLTQNEKREIFQRTQATTGLSLQIIEKDWWVTTVLKALFTLPYANQLSFKGGTSLSKCWNLIERFSEDIDIAISREYLGFGGTLTKTQISDKLRRVACTFVRETLQNDLVNQLEKMGLSATDFSVNVTITPVTTTDPEIIEVLYQSLFDELTYIKRKVIIEISGRSMSEPILQVSVHSMIDEAFPQASFTEPDFTLSVAAPQRTFWEKICLLHEEFAKQSLIRTERMSRHLYDIIQMAQTPIANEALSNKELYQSIVEHRRTFIGLKDFDYGTLAPQTICIVPPENVIELWRKDYEQMQETMIYGDSMPFDTLIQEVRKLNEKISQITF